MNHRELRSTFARRRLWCHHKNFSPFSHPVQTLNWKGQLLSIIVAKATLARYSTQTNHWGTRAGIQIFHSIAIQLLRTHCNDYEIKRSKCNFSKYWRNCVSFISFIPAAPHFMGNLRTKVNVVGNSTYLPTYDLVQNTPRMFTSLSFSDLLQRCSLDDLLGAQDPYHTRCRLVTCKQDLIYQW